MRPKPAHRLHGEQRRTYSLVLLVNVAGLGQLDVPGAELSGGGELDSVLGTGDHDGVSDLGEVPADTGKLPRRHLHHTAVLLLLEAQADTRLDQARGYHLVVLLCSVYIQKNCFLP